MRVTAEVRVGGQTGVEMEALTAVSVACLTIYDMVKAVDKEMVIQGVRPAREGRRSVGPLQGGRLTTMALLPRCPTLWAAEFWRAIDGPVPEEMVNLLAACHGRSLCAAISQQGARSRPSLSRPWTATPCAPLIARPFPQR